MTEIEKKEELAALPDDLSQLPIAEKVNLALESKLLPAWVKTPAKALTIIQMAHEMGIHGFLTPFKYFYIIDNEPSLTVYGMSALIRSRGHQFEVLKDAQPIYLTDNPNNLWAEGNLILDSEGQPQQVAWGTTLRGFRKEAPDTPLYASWLEADSEAAGLVKKGNWVKWRRDMYYARALSRLGRRYFADVLEGYYLPDELDDRGVISYNEAGEVIEEFPQDL